MYYLMIRIQKDEQGNTLFSYCSEDITKKPSETERAAKSFAELARVKRKEKRDAEYGLNYRNAVKQKQQFYQI
jgi:hypothetical protein